MEYVFRDFLKDQASVLEPGALYLRAPRAEDQNKGQLASLALESGPDAFDRGEGTIKRIVIQADPTVDDMLAATFLAHLLAGQKLPAGARAFAVYAGLAKEGLKPTADIPLQCSVQGIYLAIRREAGEDLTRPEVRDRFLVDWSRMAKRILEAAEAGVDPFTQSPFATDPEFARARSYLGGDRDIYYQQDVPGGERWWVHLPGKPSHQLAGLLLRRPRSALWKYWAREDPEAPGGKGYSFLAVFEEEKHWRFSTDPVRRLPPIDGLARELQKAETAREAARAAQDPWYDGSRHQGTIIGAPRSGTTLTDKEVLAIVKRWSRARSVEASRWRQPALVAAGFLLLGGALAFYLGMRSLPPPAPPPSAPLVEVLHFHQRTKEQRLEPETIPVHVETGRYGLNAEVDVDLDKGQNDIAFRTIQRGSRPMKLYVTLESEDELSLENLTIQVNGDGPAHRLPLVQRGKRQIQDKLDAVFRHKTNTLTISGINTAETPLRVKLQVGWEVDFSFKPTLHLLAIGISTYEDQELSVDNGREDAEELVEAFRDQSTEKGGDVFQKVLLAGGKPLINDQARRDSIRAALDSLTREVRGHPYDLVVITFSGHGMIDDLGRFLFLPHEYRRERQDKGTDAVSSDEMQQFLRRMDCPVILVIDACASGGFHPEAKLKKAMNDMKEKFSESNDGIVVLAACRSNERTPSLKKLGHGLLTLAVLERLKGKRLYPKEPAEDLPSVGRPVTLADLREYGEKRVAELAEQFNSDQSFVVDSTDDMRLDHFPIASAKHRRSKLEDRPYVRP